MIFDIEQAKTNFNMVWFATQKDSSPLCTAISPFEKGQINIELDYSSGDKKRLYYNPSDTSYGNSLFDRLSFKLLDEANNLMGTISAENKKIKGFLQSYTYRVMKTNGKAYYLYEVGFGSRGLFLCIYDGEELIAIAEKSLTVINYKDGYTVYSLSKETLQIIIPLIMYYDITAHGDVMEISLMSAKHKKVNTVQKELIAKYDPTFIQRIKDLDQIS